MTQVSHIPVKLQIAQGALTANQAVNLSGDTFKGLWVKAGSGIPNLAAGGVQFVADITSSNSEDTNIGSRPTLSGVTWGSASTTNTVQWSFSNITYSQTSSDDGLSRYFVIYDATPVGGDTASPVVLFFDPGTSVSVTASSLTLQSPSGGALQFTGGG